MREGICPTASTAATIFKRVTAKRRSEGERAGGRRTRGRVLTRSVAAVAAVPQIRVSDRRLTASGGGTRRWTRWTRWTRCPPPGPRSDRLTGVSIRQLFRPSENPHPCPRSDLAGEPCTHLQVHAMSTAASDLTRVVLALIAQGPPRRVGILRPRPAGLPHPWRRLVRLRGVVWRDW